MLAIKVGVRKFCGSSEYRTKVITWRQQHPSHGKATLFGDTAILNWIFHASADLGAIQSCDIFVYRDAYWRVIYSQHVGV